MGSAGRRGYCPTCRRPASGRLSGRGPWGRPNGPGTGSSATGPGRGRVWPRPPWPPAWWWGAVAGSRWSGSTEIRYRGPMIPPGCWIPPGCRVRVGLPARGPPGWTISPGRRSGRRGERIMKKIWVLILLISLGLNLGLGLRMLKASPGRMGGERHCRARGAPTGSGPLGRPGFRRPPSDVQPAYGANGRHPGPDPGQREVFAGFTAKPGVC